MMNPFEGEYRRMLRIVDMLQNGEARIVHAPDHNSVEPVYADFPLSDWQPQTIKNHYFKAGVDFVGSDPPEHHNFEKASYGATELESLFEAAKAFCQGNLTLSGLEQAVKAVEDTRTVYKQQRVSRYWTQREW